MANHEGDGDRFLGALERSMGGKVELSEKELAAINWAYNQMGQIQMGQLISRVAEGMTLSQLKAIHDGKLHKFLISPETGRPMTFQQFCATIGLSDGIVREKLRTLDRLGGEFLQLVDAMGLHRQQVRLLLAAPGQIQAEASALAEAAARGEVPQAEVEQRLGSIVDRLEKLEEASAGRQRLVEERDEAMEARDGLAARLEGTETKLKEREKQLKQEKQRAADLDTKLRTPPKLRDPALARAWFQEAEGYFLAIVGRTEETARLFAHYAEEGAWEQVNDFFLYVLDRYRAGLDSVVRWYDQLLALGTNVGLGAEVLDHYAVVNMLRGDRTFQELGRRVVDQMKADAAAKDAAAGGTPQEG